MGLGQNPVIVLASQSGARKRLLKRLGYRFKAVPAFLDEESYRAKSPRALVALLAREKALAVAVKYPSAIVIGSDQMLVLGKKIFGKPHTKENAIAQLLACSGKTVQLLTAVTIIFPTSQTKNTDVIVKRHRDRSTPNVPHQRSFTNTTKLTFHSLSLDEITSYVTLDNPLECAGSFMIEKNGLRLFAKIETEDATAIEGLPCLELNAILRHALNA